MGKNPHCEVGRAVAEHILHFFNREALLDPASGAGMPQQVRVYVEVEGTNNVQVFRHCSAELLGYVGCTRLNYIPRTAERPGVIGPPLAAGQT